MFGPFLDDYDPLTMEPKGRIKRLIVWLGGPLQIVATIITGAGTILVAQTDANLRLIGFIVWLGSNVLWITWALRTPRLAGFS